MRHDFYACACTVGIKKNTKDADFDFKKNTLAAPYFNYVGKRVGKRLGQTNHENQDNFIFSYPYL